MAKYLTDLPARNLFGYGWNSRSDAVNIRTYSHSGSEQHVGSDTGESGSDSVFALIKLSGRELPFDTRSVNSVTRPADFSQMDLVCDVLERPACTSEYVRKR